MHSKDRKKNEEDTSLAGAAAPKVYQNVRCDQTSFRIRIPSNNMCIQVSFLHYLLTEAIWTRQLSASGESVAGSAPYRSKKSWSVENSRNAGLHEVGIWTVQRSSELSSVDVPMKSKVRQLCARRRSCFNSSCWDSSLKFRFFLQNNYWRLL